MISKIYLLSLFAVFLVTSAHTLPHRRYRRLINSQKRNDLSYDERAVRLKTPSGSIMGTYYYGVGADPNYGSFIAAPNRPQGSGFLSISYDPNSNLNGYLINPDHQNSQQNYGGNNNNAWQRPYTNNNNRFSGGYPPGSQGWYATGGNYWYNKGQSLMPYPCLLLTTILILIIGI